MEKFLTGNRKVKDDIPTSSTRQSKPVRKGFDIIFGDIGATNDC
jgi:hypothetical protein